MHRGDVWNLSIGNETRGTASATRLVLIVSNDALSVLPLRVVVPLLPWKDEYITVPWMVRIPPVLNSGLEGIMAADALQVRSVSSSRLKGKLGSLPERLVNEVSTAIAILVNDPGQAQV